MTPPPDPVDILVLTDLHAGSMYAPMLPVVESPQGVRYRPSKLQKMLFDFYVRTLARIGPVDACFCLGDMIDGVNRHSEGYGAWTADKRLQVETAVALLGMVETETYVGVQGTPYHVGDNTTSDLAIMDALGGRFGTDLAVVMGGCRFHLAHQIGTSASPASTSSAPTRELANARTYKDTYGPFDLILRGHRHRYYQIEDDKGHIVGVPGWKTRDDFAKSRGLGMPAPHIGCCVIHIIAPHRFWVEKHLLILNREHQFVEVTL